MIKFKEKFKTVLNTWNVTLGTIKKNPVLLVPFLIVGLFDTLILVLIYLAPRPPLSGLLAPPIRVFWGERFLHYPYNLFLIPKLFNYVHIAATAFIGVLMTGLAIGMLKQVKEGLKPNMLFNLIRSIKMYLRLLVIWLMVFGLVSAVVRGLPFVLQIKQGVISQIIFYISFLISILIETIFIYAMPAVMIEKKKAWPAVIRSLSLSKKIFLPSLILVIIPTLFYIPIVFLRGKLPALMNKFFPEMVLVILGLGIIASVIIDCLITCSTTILFLNQKRT